MVKVTEAAAIELKEIIAGSKTPTKNLLRIYFGGYG